MAQVGPIREKKSILTLLIAVVLHSSLNIAKPVKIDFNFTILL